MSDIWIFSLGLALLFVLCAVIGRRLRPEYRSRLGPSIQTVAAMGLLCGSFQSRGARCRVVYMARQPSHTGGGWWRDRAGSCRGGGIPERCVRVSVCQTHVGPG